MDIRVTLEKYHMVRSGDLVLAAVSGGADSVCMLRLLLEASSKMEFTLAAVHVEHGIRGEESLADMRFTQELCKALGVPLRVCHVDVPGYAAEHGLGYEEAARQLRYEAFDRVVEEVLSGEWIVLEDHPSNGLSGGRQIHIALAHHAQDQAETVMFRLARGTGTEGLAGMRPVSSREVRKRSTVDYGRMSEAYDIIRPMLYMSRAEIEHLLEERGQAWCSDATNQDISYARNRLRLRVLPELTQVNPRAVEHIVQTAEILEQQQDYIAMEAAKALKRIGWPQAEETQPEEGVQREGKGLQQDEERTQREGKGLQQDEERTQWEGEGLQKEAERTQWEAEGGQRGICLEIPGLLELHPALQREVLRQALMQVAKQHKDLTAGHVEQLLELTQKQSGSMLSLPYGVEAVREFSQIRISRRCIRKPCGRTDSGREYGGKEYGERKNDGRDTAGRNDCRKADPGKPLLCGQESIDSGTITEIEMQKDRLQALLESGETQIIALGEEERLEICVLPVNILSENCKKKYTKCFDYDMMIEGFSIRRRRAGDYLRMPSGHRKKLKQYLIEAKIPAAERQHLWLLAQDSCVLWVVGGRVGAGCEVTEHSRFMVCVTYRD